MRTMLADSGVGSVTERLCVPHHNPTITAMNDLIIWTGRPFSSAKSTVDRMYSSFTVFLSPLINFTAKDNSWSVRSRA